MLEKLYSHKEALAYVCWLLRQHTYQAQLSAGSIWKEAERKAQRWSSIGRAGVLFSVEEELDRCIDAQGSLIATPKFAWQGDPDLIRTVMKQMHFDPTFLESQASPTWSYLTVSELHESSISLGKQTVNPNIILAKIQHLSWWASYL